MANYKYVDADQLDEDLASVADRIRSKGGTTSPLAFPDGFNTAIDAISTGVTVQVKTGTVTGVSGTAKTVRCGFKPDAVFFTGRDAIMQANVHCGVAFKEANVTSMETLFGTASSSYLFSILTVTQNSSGFSVSGKRLSTSGTQTNESNRSLSYIAIKYTE